MSEIKKLKYYVNGEFKASKTQKYTDAFNPSTGEVIAKVPCCTPDEINKTIGAAKAAYPQWSATPVRKRMEVLYRLRGLLTEHREELTELVAYENGFYLGSTVFDHVTPEMTVGDYEIFGPVLCIKRVKSFEEGLAVMNANPFANGSVIFTQNGAWGRMGSISIQKAKQ